MPKTIGIFGDSFSDPAWNQNNYVSWPELLEQEYAVTNFSKSGSSLWFSYQQLKNNQNTFDICIFVATVYGRFYLETLDHHLNINTNTWPVKHGINLGELYYKEFFSFDRDVSFHNFMINDILTMPNVIFIPAYEECMISNDCISLNHFANAELHYYGVLNYQGPDDRKCHLSKENNLVIYKKILNAIKFKEKTIPLSMDDFIAPTDPFNFYFNRIIK